MLTRSVTVFGGAYSVWTLKRKYDIPIGMDCVFEEYPKYHGTQLFASNSGAAR
jgi:hypothetical protein